MLNNFYKLLILLFLSSLSVISYAWQISGEVVDVHDGDTIIVVDDDKGYKRIIRLSAIDAPELLQSFGKESKNHLLEVSLGRQIQADCYRTIRARVEICRVLVGDIDLAVAQLEAGFAWRYRLYSDGHNPKYRFLYAKAEKLAEEEKKGLWSSPTKPVTPWRWRERYERWDDYMEWYWHKDW